MKTPIRCRFCKHVVGMATDREREEGKIMLDYYPPLPCMGHHPPPEKKERTYFFGLIKEVTKIYHETRTANTRYYYVGRANRFLLWVALLRARGGLRIQKNYVYWNLRGFFGPGYGELFRH